LDPHAVGEVEMVDMKADGIGWGEFLHVRILIDLAKPLAQGRMLKVQGKSKWIVYQYECLPRHGNWNPNLFTSN
jgi:hypothetical protein